MKLNYTLLPLAMALLALPAQASFEPASVRSFVAEMSERHGFDRGELQRLFDQAEHKPAIIEAISRPAERVRPWHEYRELFINDQRIGDGVAFFREHRETLERVSRDSGVPAELLVAILGIETQYGRITGGYRVIDALSTLAFDYPPRSAFFRGELEQFLLLTREERVDPLAAVGSYAGAMGAPQFISSSYRRYAVDGNGDGRRDLWGSWHDVFGSMANYLAKHGWETGGPVVSRAELGAADPAALVSKALALDSSVGALRENGVRFDAAAGAEQAVLLFELSNASGPEYWVGFRNFYVITRYNRSRKYAMAVLELGNAIAESLGAGG